MNIELLYGESTLTAEVPDENLMKVGYTSELKEIKDTKAKIIEHLRNPTGTRRLSSVVSQRDKVAVIVDDYARSCPDDVLPHPDPRGVKRRKEEGRDREHIKKVKDEVYKRSHRVGRSYNR